MNANISLYLEENKHTHTQIKLKLKIETKKILKRKKNHTKQSSNFSSLEKCLPN